MKKNLEKMNQEIIEYDPFYSEVYIQKILFDIARNLNSERLRQGVSITKLQEITGVDSGFIYRIEKAEKKPGTATIIKLAHALHINLNDLYKVCPEDENEKRAETIINMTRGLDDTDFSVLVDELRTLITGFVTNKVEQFSEVSELNDEVKHNKIAI